MSELYQSWGDLFARLLVRIPQLASEAGLGAWPIAALALAAGVAMLLIGVRLGPLLAGVAGAAIAWFVAVRHPAFIASWGVPPGPGAWVATATAGFACAFVPPLYPILLGALPGAMWGAGIPLAGRPWLGAVATAVVLGAVSLAARRVVFAATAAMPGALLIDASVLVLAARFPSLGALTSRSTLFAAMTAVLIVAGTAAQVSTQGPMNRRGDGESRARRVRPKRDE